MPKLRLCMRLVPVPALTFAVIFIVLLISPLSLSSQNNFSLSLDLDSSEGDQAVQSLDLLPHQDVSIQIFGTDIQAAIGLSVRFEYNATDVVYEAFDAGDVLPNSDVMVSQGKNPGSVEINMASSGESVTVNSGLIGTLRFRTTDVFWDTEILLIRAKLDRSGRVESVMLNVPVALLIALPPSPDIDGNGVVDTDDFLLWLPLFGTSRGDAAYQDRFDMDGNGKIDISDFLILSDNFGNAVPVAVGTLDPVILTYIPSAQALRADPVTVDVSGNFSDADNDALTYTAVSDDEAIAVVRVDGSAVAISPVGVGNATITVTATDAGGLSAMQAIAVSVRPELAFAASSIRRAVDENTPAGENIGEPVAVAGLDSLTYRLSGADADSFAIDPGSGQIRTREGVTYNYEGKQTYFVRVVVSDQWDSDADSIIVSIRINDVNEPPSSPPSNFLVMPDDESLTVHYHAVPDERGRPPVRGYQAEIRRGESGPWGTGKTIYGRTNTSVYYHKIDAHGYHSRILVNGQLYQVRVRAYNSEGASAWSEPVSGTPVYVPPKKKERPIVTAPKTFSGEAPAEINISESTGEEGRIIVPQAALPASISPDEVKGVFVEIVKVEVSNVPDVPVHAGFTIPGSSTIFDIDLKAQFQDGEEVNISGNLSAFIEICLPVPAGVSNPVLVRYNEDSDRWEVLANQRVNGNVVCALTDRFSLFSVGKRVEVTAGLCDRTSQVQAAILSELSGVSDCGLVTTTNLASITGPLVLINEGITTLKANDFSNLSSLEILRLQENSLTTFPADVFSDLSSLTTLRLDNNDLSTLPADVFSDLSSLTTLNLKDNDLSTLPAGVFSDLSKLETLNLRNNDLSTLSDSIFVGLSSLTSLDLRENPGAEFTLTLQLDRTDADNDATGPATIVVKVAEGAPFAMTVGLSATGVTLSASSATIAAGSIESDPITVTQTGTGQVTVSLGDAPDVPRNYNGISTAVGTPLVLFPALPVPTFSGQTIDDQTYTAGTVITDGLTLPAASDGDGTLTYTLSPDADNNGVPDLPRGLTFDATTRTISGTPLTAFATTTFTYTATDADGDTAELMFTITVPTGICDHTSQVQTAILSEISGVSDCGLVTNADLASITGPLILINEGITTLKANDFSNLSSLEILRLQDNSLTTLSTDIFSDLSSLTTLRLDNNDLSTLPADVFSGLSSLEILNLQANDLSTLPDSIFVDLSSLETLNLRNNDLSTLPDSIFVGLTSLTSLDLRGNPGAEFTLTLQLDRTDADNDATGPATVKVVVAQGAPFAMTVGLSVTNGTLSATSATIAAGSTESDPITVTQTGTGQVTVSLGDAPDVPRNYRGISTTVGTPLVLFPALPVPTFSGQTIADQTYALNSQIADLTVPTASGGDGTLTYTLSPDADNNGVPDLPAGLTFDATTRTISGTPSEVFPTTTFTYTVTDTDGDTAELMFTITVPTGICDRTQAVYEEILDLLSASDCGLVTNANLASIRGILNLNDQGITTLQANDFSNLSSLDTLRLKDNNLSALPAGVFSDLSSLETLNLRNNDLSTLSDSIFVGLSSLSSLDLRENPDQTNPVIFPLTLQLDRTDADNDATGPATIVVKVAEGAPFAMTVGLSATGVTLSASSATIAAGSIESDPITVTQTGTGQVTVSLGSAPDVPSNYRGISTAVGTPLVLFPALPVPTFSGQTIDDQTYTAGTVITDGLTLPAASDGDGTLTYTLSPDADNNGVPDLPAGLTFDATTRTISGTPLTAFATTTFTYTATDADGDTATLTFDITVTGICNRTQVVYEEILDLLSASDCGLVTTANLASITGPLVLINEGITTLKANDFSNLSSLEILRLQENSLTTFPADVFSDLSSLTTLRLDNNDLSTLPADVFSDLSSLTTLNLQANDLSTLPDSIFVDLSSLTTLNLRNNDLSTLSDSIFVGLSSLTSLDLRGNPGAEFTLTLELDRSDADNDATGPATVKVVVAQGAPFEMTVGLSVTNGTLSATSATIAAGSTESDPITVTQTGTGQVTVSLEGPAPTPPMGTSFRKIKTALSSTTLVLF